MKTKKKLLLLPLILLITGLVVTGAYFLLPRCIPAGCFGFSRNVPDAEAQLRTELVDTACGWDGVREEDGSHRSVIDLYNTLDPLPQGYRVNYDDAWCAAFVTAAAIEAGLTDVIPPECSCARQIALFQEQGRWEEDDGYLPLPGDVIYYDWDLQKRLDCIDWPEHVGIVAGTFGPFIRVMEGNKRGGIAGYRVIWRNDWCIRGYGLPDYAGKSE